MIDIRKHNKKIKNSIEYGFRVDVIKVNLNQHTPDFEEEEYMTMIDQWKRIAHSQFDIMPTVELTDSIDTLVDYEIVCDNCGNRPFYNSSKEKYYCPQCEGERDTVFDY